jgi:valyl-tRNA synthetase
MLSKEYHPAEVEKKWKERWETWGIYRFDEGRPKPIFSIDTPPPTVSGEMHLGHAFSYSQMDFIARYKRMKGHNLFYPFGTDDNGLPTERLIESRKGVKAREMGREAFVRLCLETLREIRPGFIQGWKDIGLSPDWSLDYSTIDDHCRRISQRSFLRLYQKGRVYRKETPFLWCPSCHTAISQVELEDRERESSFSDIVFRREDGGDLIIGTTRPELLPACVAVFVHPEDERYAALVGKKVRVPLFHQEVVIRADERVDPSKGTGAVMCCTFGDMTDIEWYLQHNLPLKVAITPDGRMTELAGKYAGMELKEARRAILEDLGETGLLVVSRSITHHVNVHERCGTEIEILNTQQWFIRYLDLKEEFLEAGRKIRWFPDHMRNRYENWVLGLKWDWCISRQRYFGVPFPLWYCRRCGAVQLAEEDRLPVDPLTDRPSGPCGACGAAEFDPEEDVMDTWATSSLTPDIAIERVKDPSVRERLYPMSLRPQAHDIIAFWLFNTVVQGLLHRGVVPWRDALISGWALDPEGKKMSKSKGNVIEPREVLEKYSADALRFWAAGSKVGEDLPYQEKDLVTAKKFLTKLWNASRFALSHLSGGEIGRPSLLHPTDRWILSKLNRLIEEVTSAWEEYEFAAAKGLTTQFILHTFCDDYLEMVKFRLYGKEKEEDRESARYTLYRVLLACLKLLAPILPFITEEIYQAYYRGAEGARSIHVSPWPRLEEGALDEEAEEEGDLVARIVSSLRRYKSDRHLPLNQEIEWMMIVAVPERKGALERAGDTIRGTMQVRELTITEEKVEVQERVTDIVPDYSALGPDFKGETPKVIRFLQAVDKETFAKELEKGNILAQIDGRRVEISPRHIKEIKREVFVGEKSVVVLDVPGFGDVSLIVPLL